MDIVKRQEIIQVFKGLPPEDLAVSVKKAHLDPLPFVVKPEEVAFLKGAAAQWGSLLTGVYRDLWGPQELLQTGVLDYELLWGALSLDPAFWGVFPAALQPLSLVRFDLVRSPQG